MFSKVCLDLANAALTISFQGALFHRKLFHSAPRDFRRGGYNFIVAEVRCQVLRKVIDIFFIEQIPPYVYDDIVAYRRGVSTFAILGVERMNERTNKCQGDRNRSREIVNSYIKGRR